MYKKRRRNAYTFPAPAPAFAAPPAFATGFGPVNPVRPVPGLPPPVSTPAGPAFIPALPLSFTPLAGAPPALPIPTPSRKGHLLATVCVDTALEPPSKSFCMCRAFPEKYSTKLLGAAILVAVAMLLDSRAAFQYLTLSVLADTSIAVAVRITFDVICKCHFHGHSLLPHSNKFLVAGGL
jgi:hypothetical protein